jgi:hypothetical protein
VQLAAKTRLFGAMAAVFIPAALLFVPRDRPPPADELAAAGRSLETAREEGAEIWAPEPWEDARRRHELALGALSRQSRRLPLLRDYEETRKHLHAASRAALRAVEDSRTARDSVEASIEALVEEAAAALAAARRAAEAAHLQSEGRKALQQAEIALAEARRYHARGAFDEARDKARRVLGLSREWESRALELLGRSSDAETLRRWNRWIAETVEWSRLNGAIAIVVDKAERSLFLYEAGTLRRSLTVDLGRNPIPDKLHEGDNATPEGRYRVAKVREPGDTGYYRAFLIDYPNEDDWQAFRRAREEGRVPGDTPIGGLIEIHGHGGRGEDWTNGCIAVSDAEMDYLSDYVVEGTPVTIVGARRPQELPETIRPSGIADGDPQPNPPKER